MQAMCRKLLAVGEELLRGREQVGLAGGTSVSDSAEMVSSPHGQQKDSLPGYCSCYRQAFT